MNTFFAIADWVYSLPPYALAALVIVLGVGLFALFLVTWALLLAARSGAGEPHPEEIEEATK